MSHQTPDSVLNGSSRWSLTHADCRSWLESLPDGCADAVVSDPPYPEIDRDYGRLSESDWHALMTDVVTQCRRVLKPTGSAVFILQPNSERVGRMRPWLWEFMAKWSRAWGMVQDAWWWNTAAMPTVHTHRTRGLMRPSLKACVWLGLPECYRAQDRVLWCESQSNAALRGETRAGNVAGDKIHRYPSGQTRRAGRISEASAGRGGVTPFNVLPMSNTDSVSGGGGHGHGAATPPKLTAWWVRYLCPKGGVVLDPFTGSGTTGLAALDDGASFLGCEQYQKHAETARVRLAAHNANTQSAPAQFALVAG